MATNQIIVRRGSVGALAILFLGCVIFVALGLYLWDKREDDAFGRTLELTQKLQGEFNSLKNKVDEMDKTITSNIATIGNANVRIKALEDENAKMRDELDVFRDQVADTREKQIKLREALAAKRPTVKLPPGPFMVEVYSKPGTDRPTPNKGQGVSAILGVSTDAKPAPAQPSATIPQYAPDKKSVYPEKPLTGQEAKRRNMQKQSSQKSKEK